MRETVLRGSLTSHKRLSGSNDFALSVSISSWVCSSGEVAAAAFSGGGDDGDGGDTANSQSRGGCWDSLTVVVNTNCLWRSSVGGSHRRGNRPSHKKNRWFLGTAQCIYHRSLRWQEILWNVLALSDRRTSILNSTERVAATSSSMKTNGISTGKLLWFLFLNTKRAEGPTMHQCEREA